MTTMNGNGIIWRYVAISAVSVSITLLGAWATHSVSKQELTEQLNNQAAIINIRLEAIQATQSKKIDDINELKLKVQRLETEMDELYGVTSTRRKR